MPHSHRPSKPLRSPSGLFIITASILALISTSCVAEVASPSAESIGLSLSNVNGNCVEDGPNIFRPECTTEWSDTLTDHTEVLNAVTAAARAYTVANSSPGLVHLKARAYYYTGEVNELPSSPAGIVVRNENHQQNQTYLMAQGPDAELFIRTGDIFQYLVIRGPYWNAATGDAWPAPNFCTYGHGSFATHAGINGSGQQGWELFASRVEGFDNHGVIMSQTRNSTVFNTVIEKNHWAGIQLVDDASGNTLRGNLIRFNGGNGIDINGDSTWVYHNNTSYNGWIDCPDFHDRNGILVWDDSTGLNSIGNLIELNWSFENEQDGIWVGTSGPPTSDVGNTIVQRNQVYDNVRHGIVVYAQDGNTTANTQVRFNTSTGNAGSQIHVQEQKSGHVDGNAQATVKDNLMAGSSCLYWGAGVSGAYSANACNGAFDSDVVDGPTTISSPGLYQWSTSADPGHMASSYEWRDGSSGTVLHSESVIELFVDPCEPSPPFPLELSVTTGSSVTKQVQGVSMWCSDPVSPLSISIIGPTDVQPNQISCTWSAAVSGGQGPYTYLWEKDGQSAGSSSTYSSSVSTTGFSLQLTVTDSQSGQDIDQIYVNPTYWGSYCELH